LLTAISIFCHNGLWAQRTKSSLSAGRQVNAEKGLKDNRYFFYFINSSITNFGTEEDKKAFREAIQRDILAQILYMKFHFGDSFTEVRTAQKILIQLYRAALTRDIEDGKKILNSFAPEVIDKKDYLSRHYLRLGYRDIESSRINMLMADNFRESLYSLRLYHYVKAIKEAKHGKRYAFFSMLEARNPRAVKPGNGSLSYSAMTEKLKNIADGNPASFEKFSLIHADNYYKSPSGQTIFDLVWEKPNLYELKEYEEYIKKD
jgi:hypothetical protein